MTENEKLIVATAINILDSYLRKEQVIFTDPTAVRNYLRLQLATLEEENFVSLFLDSQNRLIASETLFTGTIDAAPVYPRVVMKKALSYNAAAIILAHNHPSGVAEPSRADRTVTERLTQALSLVDIRVLDHFVVGNPDIVSFAERGWL